MTYDEHAELLKNGKCTEFNSITTELLCVEKSAKPDFEPTVSFLSTRVSNLTVEDSKNYTKHRLS